MKSFGNKIINIDLIDKKIINLLQEDGKASYNDIAGKVGKTEATIRRRVKKLIKNGIIKKFTILLNEDKIGKKIKCTIKIQVKHELIKEIIRKLKKIENITEIWRLSGDCGIFLKAELPTIEYLNILTEEKIARIEGIVIKETCIITAEIKSNEIQNI